MKKTLFLITLLAGGSAAADVLTSSQRFLGMGGQYPSYSEEGEEVVPSALDQAPYSPADSDLGVQHILVERPDSFPVILGLRTAVYYTDEAPVPFFFPQEASWILSLKADAAYRPHLINGWFGDFGMVYDFLQFSESTVNDYENFNFRLGVYKNLPDLDDSIVFFRYETQRLMTGSLSDGDYNGQRLRVGLQKELWSAPRHSLTSTLSYAYEWTARPDFLQRDEVSLNVGYMYSLTDAVYLKTNLRIYRYDYDLGGREDWTYATGLELVWQIDQNFKVTTSVFYDKNDSNQALGVNDVDSWTTGIGLGMEWLF